MTNKQKEEIMKLCDEYDLVEIQEHNGFKVIYLSSLEIDRSKVITENKE